MSGLGWRARAAVIGGEAAKPERLVRLESAVVHGAQHGHAGVGVVVDADARLASAGAHEASGVLDEAAFEGDGEGEEEGVELWAVEAFAEVLAGGDDGQRLVLSSWRCKWRTVSMSARCFTARALVSAARAPYCRSSSSA